MPITIPQEHKAAIASLITLSDEEADRLFNALNAAAPTILPRALAQRVAEESNLPKDSVAEIVDVLISLITNRDWNELATEKIANDVAAAAAAEHLGGLEPNSPAVLGFAQRVSRFLNLDRSLGVTSKAMNVLTQHKNPFRSARILTDIRAVFSTGDDPSPSAALIVHNLQLVTTTDGLYSTFIVALDTQDLRALASVISRAIKKEERLKEVIKRSGLSYIDVVPLED
jgi:hypothetical protein